MTDKFWHRALLSRLLACLCERAAARSDSKAMCVCRKRNFLKDTAIECGTTHTEFQAEIPIFFFPVASAVF